METEFDFFLSDAKSTQFILKRGKNLEQQLYVWMEKKLPQFNMQRIETRIEESGAATCVPLKEKVLSRNSSLRLLFFKNRKFHVSDIHKHTHYSSLSLQKKESHFDRVTREVNPESRLNALYILTLFKKARVDLINICILGYVS